MSQPKKTKKDEPSLLESATRSMEHLNSPKIQLFILGGLGIAALSVFVMNFFGGVEQFRGILQASGPFAPLAFIVLKASTYVIAPLSGTPLRLAAGALFGFWDGFLYIIIGDLLGASLNFWIARLFRDKAIARLAGKKALKQLDEITQHVGGWRALLFARLFLSSLYDFISYAAGLSNLPYRQFFLVTLFAGIPSTLASAFVGDSFVTNQPLFLTMIGISVAAILLALASNKWLGNKTK